VPIDKKASTAADADPRPRVTRSNRTAEILPIKVVLLNSHVDRVAHASLRLAALSG
jgi:hypothetical protein